MTRNSTVFHFSGSFPDGDGLGDLPARVFKDTRVLRPAYAALGSQVLQQLLFQQSARLDERASVNSFVGHTHALIIGILDFQPSGADLYVHYANVWRRGSALSRLLPPAFTAA